MKALHSVCIFFLTTDFATATYFIILRKEIAASLFSLTQDPIFMHGIYTGTYAFDQ